MGGGFDLILMDGHVPDIDGYAATTRIRAAFRARSFGPGVGV
jgi:CheY-like chemotaxis protein